MEKNNSLTCLVLIDFIFDWKVFATSNVWILNIFESFLNCFS